MEDRCAAGLSSRARTRCMASGRTAERCVQDRAGLVLGIVGLSAFATGFLHAKDLARALPHFDLDLMTSRNLFDFAAANMRLLSLAFFFGEAFVYGRDRWTKMVSIWKKLLLLPLWLVIAVSTLLVPLVSGVGAV